MIFRIPSSRIFNRLSVSLLAAAGLLNAGAANAAGSINALVWCDHTDPEFIEPFEQANDVKVNLKEFEGTGAALSILEQSRPGDWDVLIIDGVDVPALAKDGLLASVPEEALPIADIWPQVLMEQNHKIDGQWYGMTELFGYNTIAYNRDNVDPADMLDMTSMWSGKYKDRIAVYDWHTPMIGLVAMGLGKKTADLSEADLPEIKETLFELKANASQFTDVVASQTALATGEVDILFGGGEWLTGVLSQEMPNLDWVLPEQGGLLWSQSVTMLADAQNPDMALKFMQYILSPEGQARLATSSCYWAMPANMKTGDQLNDQQKAALRWDQQQDYLNNAQLYPSVDADLNVKMEDLWTEMLQQ
ncbi:ABC transporter substrate-binding protein [Chromatiales bacterium (ex Bugula neritina AB1)]|nr:ABC transporter substrate-binding protein [Chromatiales bacterium (ex Bugula neritina AB1)]